MKDLLQRHAIELLLAALFLCAGAYFYNGANWNHVSRFDVAFCFVEPGPDQFSFRINRLVWNPKLGENTGDWAQNPEHDDNYYSNKAPGPALLAIPVYAVLYGVERLAGQDPTQPVLTYLNCYIINLIVTVLPAAISILFMFWLLSDIFDNRAFWPTLLCVALYFGTLLWPYSTQFWGHVTATAFLIAGLYFFRADTPRGYVFSGLFLGLAVLSEYSVAIPLLALTGVLLYRFCRPPRAGGPPRYQPLALLCAGGAAPLLLFMVYHYLCFGNPLTLATFHNNSLFKDEGAIGGLFQFRDSLRALWHLTFSSYRGLFFHMPVMLTVFAAVVAVPKLRKHWLFWVATSSILGFFAMNLTFNGWHGGACIGPRYQICAFPFYILLAGFGIRRLSERLAGTALARPFGVLFLLLLAASVSNMLITVSVSPTSPALQPYHDFREREYWSKPLFYFYYSFRQGHLRPFHYNPIRPAPETASVKRLRLFNMGELMGLRGTHVVIPLLVVLAAGFAIVGWLVKRSTAEDDGPDPGPPAAAE